MSWTPTPGIHRNVPEADYHADREAVSNSWLGRIAQTPMHLRHYLDSPPTPQTPAMLLGSVVHTMVLEPDLMFDRYVVGTPPRSDSDKSADLVAALVTDTFEDNYSIRPQVDGRTKAGKAANASFEHDLGDRAAVTLKEVETARELLRLPAVWGIEDWALTDQTYISPDTYENAMRSTDAIIDHPTAGAIVRESLARELTLIWDDNGTLCKARADLQTPDGLADLKTTASAMPGDFARSSHNYRYHIQQAHYLAGADANNLPGNDFLFLCVEPSPPYPVAVYRLDSDFVRLGTEKRAEALETYAACLDNDCWPGYPENVTELSPPAWAMREVA